MASKGERLTMRDFSQDHRWLSVNTATLRKQQGAEVPLNRIIDQCAAQGVRAISPWRDQVAAVGLEQVARQLKALDMELSGYCRGGFYPAADAGGLRAALDDNRRAIDEAKTLEAPCLVLVVGALPGALQGKPAYKDLARARGEVRDGIAASLEYAREVGMPLAIEPLHPMQAADRACINTLEQALDLCDELDPLPNKNDGKGQQASAQSNSRADLGVALDVYHCWWDPKLEQQIARAGQSEKSRLLAYHVCDWLTPTRDLLSDRGMMGDGVIELRKIRGWVEAAGYAGYSEVEIFSTLDWWLRPGEETLATRIERHCGVV
jgi:sugar phosphate isomerase/epimerase